MTDRIALPSERVTIDAFEFARTGGHLARHTAVQALPRLAASLLADEAAAAGPVDWTLDGSVGPQPGGGPASWLQLRARFAAPMRCMRCLEPVVLPVQVDRRFKLEHDERAVELEPLDEDAFDLVLGQAHFDVLALLEDEALLALPLVPRHEDCALPAGADEAAPSERASPFAALAAWRPAPAPEED